MSFQSVLNNAGIESIWDPRKTWIWISKSGYKPIFKFLKFGPESKFIGIRFGVGSL